MDVTERRHAEAVRARMLVREQEARAHQERAAEVTGIVQHMPCGVLVFDEDACLTLANERALEMLSPRRADDDPPPGDALVPHPSDMLEDRLLGPCRALVGLALGGSVVGDRELEIETSGARDRLLVGSAAPLRSAQGDVRGAVVILTDVTRERRLMQDLVTSEGTLRQSLESLLVLHEAGRALSSTLLEEEIGRRLVEGCMRIARLDAALVFLDNGDDEPRLLGADGDPLLVEHVLGCDKERRFRRYVLQFSSSAGASPVPACPELAIGVGHHVELVARGRTVGVLEIYGSEPLTVVTADALSSLAAHAVSALENAHLYREVGDREQRLQDALRHLLIAQEEERRRVAYELHDGLAQVAAATHLSLQTFASRYRSRSPQRQQQLERSVDLARRVVREARQVIGGLRPTVLDDFGLERALRLHVQELVAEGWAIEYDAQLGADRLPGPTETVIYRIAQEALTNVRKHAQTLEVTVSLHRGEGYVELNVVDRGVGFSQAARREESGPGHRLGLVGMRERAALVGGLCVVRSEPGAGTRVTVRIPLHLEAEAAPVSAAPVGTMRHAS
jgi:signal transduction histidine kinase